MYGAQRGGKSGAASSGGALHEVLVAAGLANDPSLKPNSLPAWAGRRVFEQTGSMIEVAQAMGLRSLDAAARHIGEDWR